ncbi:OmpA family protein [Flavihumibacter profundi]|jgi:chemotaxis protein MotB|uniref:OmpA family protein n=1 Tax=Flavihumibacter profundi TaxID=2716883 RepID=UPI001CC7DEE3|nr:OmpA family protein [Flavihumibacter profundi]MBZ5856068.1 OmpA family protein [Flavihumibacter profundi]
MKSKFTASILIVLAIAFTSCVSSKKYKSAEAQSQKLQTELTSCDNNLKGANDKIAELNKQVSDLTSQNATLSVDAAKYQHIKANAEMREARLNAALAEQGTSMEEIRDKLVSGLSALIDSGMEVSYKEGLLHINLPEKMLFTPGSATLSKSSKNALSALASIMNDYPKVQIYVVGHTDTQKIHTARFEDNWSLSTERANSIVRVFRDKYSVDPTRLLSAGRGKYMPVATNDTKEGRTLNRRIEIILNPNLIKLWELMNQ